MTGPSIITILPLKPGFPVSTSDFRFCVLKPPPYCIDFAVFMPAGTPVVTSENSTPSGVSLSS